MKKKFVYYPILFFTYPVIFLWSQNLQQIAPVQVYRSLLFTTLFGVLLYMSLSLIFRQWEKAALISSIYYLSFFIYGHFFNLLESFNQITLRHRFVLPVYIFVFVIWLFLILKSKVKIETWNLLFTAISFVLLLQPIYTFASYTLFRINKEDRPTPVVIANKDTINHPDIYYIILDGYGREDTLREYYDYDNSAFIDYLKGKGFYVASQSTSNYISTVLSISSSLNMQYIDVLTPDINPLENNEIRLAGYEADLVELIHHSDVRNFLAVNGYRMVAYDNQFKTTAKDADVLLSYSPLFSHENKTSIAINGFEGLLLETSIMKVWVDWRNTQGMGNLLIQAPYMEHRARVMDMFDALQETVHMEGNNFVFMHFLVPHPPFVFGPNGEILQHDIAFSLSDGVNYPGTSRRYIREYVGQISYINQHLQETIDYIIKNSQTPPVIIIQGDHGPRVSLNFKNPKIDELESPFANLNAYYLPTVNYDVLYPTLTPVNSFRIIFNIYFDAGYDLLPDKNYLSNSIRPFDFINVTDIVK